jgi:hypothetical protein
MWSWSLLRSGDGKNVNFDILSILFLAKSYLLTTQVSSGKMWKESEL